MPPLISLVPPSWSMVGGQRYSDAKYDFFNSQTNSIFLSHIFVNTAMVTGLIPVVGVPLPLISYGGSSMVSLMIGFGILMSIQSHQKLIVQK